jgi:glucosamine-phosphate N-acetyltransferase
MNSNEYQFRKLNICDKNEYLRLMFNFTNYKYEISDEKFKEILNTKNLQVLLLTLKDKIIGCGSIFKLEKLHNNPICQIEDVFIDEEFRGKGYGKVIVDYLKNYGKNEWKCYKIVLNCLDKNIGFYKNCGFIESGVQFKAI